MRKYNTNEYLMSEARKALGKQGGEATKKKHGVEHYKAMSAKGVAARKLSPCPNCESMQKPKDIQYLGDGKFVCVSCGEYCEECQSTPCKQL